MNEAATTWALVVGIDQYDSDGVPPLQGAVADALASVSWLRSLGVPDGQILLNASAAAGSASADALQMVNLPSAPAKQASIAASIHRLSQAVGGTRLLVFLCGHGFYEPSSGPMFLVQDFDVSGQWPNLGINPYTQKFLSLPFRRQFMFMDGCLNYPYPESLRQRFQALGPIGEAPPTPLPYTTMVTCFAASMGEQALERGGRGVFLSTLLPQLDPSNPVPDYGEALTYSFDHGTRTVDLGLLINCFVSQRVAAATSGAQHPRVFVEGAGESVDGAYPLFRVLPDPPTVTVSLTVDPPHAAGDVKRLSVWLGQPPFASKYLYQPPPLVVPVHTRLPQGADGIAECELPPDAPWDLVHARTLFKADTDQTVLFSLSPRDGYPGIGPDTNRLSVKIASHDGTPYQALGSTEYERIAQELGLPGPPARGQSVDGVTFEPHEDGPEFTADPEAASAGAETAAAWADALRAAVSEGLTITTSTRGGVAPANGKLRLQLPFGGARRLAGPLADRPSVVIERGAVTRSPAWRLSTPATAENIDGVKQIVSLTALEEQPNVAMLPGPARVSVELPWGSWTTTALAPTSGTQQIDLPATIGVPPLRVALTDDLPYLADLDRSGYPMILGLQGGAPEATLVSLFDRNGTDPAVVAAPRPSAAWGVQQPGLLGVLRLEGHQAIMFPLAGRSLAIDDLDSEPRVEPMSTSTAPEWDLLIGTGQLDVLDAKDGLFLAQEADDELLRLAGAYVLYARGALTWLRQVLSGGRQSGQIDEALLQLAAINATSSSPARADLVLNQIHEAANQGRVPVLRWGIDLALTVLTGDMLNRSSTFRNWHTVLAAIRPQLSPRSVWTTWSEGRVGPGHRRG